MNGTKKYKDNWYGEGNNEKINQPWNVWNAINPLGSKGNIRKGEQL